MNLSRRLRTSLLGAASAALFTTLAPPALANNLFTLDPSPATPGEVIEDGAGYAYVAWVHNAGAGTDHAMFCKIPPGGTCTAPQTLPLPDAVSPSGAFPAFGSGTTVYVVAPRQAMDDELVYTSTDGGAHWMAPASPFLIGSGDTDTSTVLRSGTSFFASSNNVGLGFSDGVGAFHFDNPGNGAVDGSSLALDSASDPVEAYWLSPTAGPPYTIGFYRYSGSGLARVQANWTGPSAVAAGYQTRLSGGASGTFLVSQDYAGGPDPSAVDVRKFTGTAFGAPIRLVNDAAVDLFAGGAISQSPGGRLAVAWPGPRTGDGAFVMRLFTSTNSGATFLRETDVARLPADYGINDNAQLALADNGGGWITFTSIAAGLQVADLTPIAPYVSPSGGDGTTPPRYTGPDRAIPRSVGRGLAIVLRVPKTCLRPGQRFKLSIAAAVKREHARGAHVTVTKAVVRLDGHRLKTIRRKPFAITIRLTGSARSRHTISAIVTAHIHRKHHRTKTVTATIKAALTVC
jgi:hypothetical protein